MTVVTGQHGRAGGVRLAPASDEYRVVLCLEADLQAHDAAIVTINAGERRSLIVGPELWGSRPISVFSVRLG